MAKKERNEKNGRSARLTKKDITQQLLTLFDQHAGRRYKVDELFGELRAKNHPSKMLVLDVLKELVLDDYLATDGRGSYYSAVRSQVMEGTFQRKRNGRNSFVPDDGGQSILVCERNSLHALDGDRVKVTMLARRNGHTREAEVIEILERAKDTFVGELQVEKGFGFLITEDRSLATDIFIPKDKLKGGKQGDKAVVQITEWPSNSKSPIGKVIDILGRKGENNAEMHGILAEYGLPYRYPKNVEDAAERLSPDITPEEIARREDFREVTTFTIDPHDAKDFDDALSIRHLEGEWWEVGVHIADVSHYVTEGSIIDREAEKRATSVYLVDRTIPMLPERLCNFICSLRPDEEKLAYSAIFEMDDNANIKKFHIAHTVIKSNRRYAYEEVLDILQQCEAKPSLRKTIENAEMLCTLARLSQILRERRFKGGAVRFDREELHFDIDEKGKPIRAYFKKSNQATQLIEEFMLIANKWVAESVGKVKKGVKAKTLPYRIHDQPDPTKLEALREFVVKFGYKMKTAGTKGAISRSLNTLMDECQGKREQNLIEIVALRSMMKAKYSTHNIGHYGLAFEYYTHFTSPIRRYPDTMVHRLLTRYQDGGRSASQDKYEELCEHCSDMEQVAQQAERDSIKYKMVEFMADKLGQCFDAHISGIQSYGIYCEIDENHCEGMVPMRDLDDDYYDFDEKNYCLVGRRHHHKYQLGDAVRIKVARANIEKRQLDFTLADDDE